MDATFPSTTLAGICTGILLEDGGVSSIRDAMSVLFPGITLAGLVVMQGAAKREIFRQHPYLQVFIDENPLPINQGGLTAKQVAEWVMLLNNEIGATLDLQGPLNISNDEIRESFDGDSEQ